MPMRQNYFLIAAGSLSALAGLMHLGCIAFGVSWYRFFGAGEKMIRLVESGSTFPTRITLLISSILFVWSAYAFSGAGLIPKLPLHRLVLCAITIVYLARGVFFYPLMSKFPENSLSFWLWSSAICATIGLIHLIGIKQAWHTL